MGNNRDFLHGGPLRDGVYTAMLDRIKQLEYENHLLASQLGEAQTSGELMPHYDGDIMPKYGVGLPRYGHALSWYDLEECKQLVNERMEEVRGKIQEVLKTVLTFSDHPESRGFRHADSKRQQYQDDFDMYDILVKHLSAAQEVLNQYRDMLKQIPEKLENQQENPLKLESEESNDGKHSGNRV